MASPEDLAVSVRRRLGRTTLHPGVDGHSDGHSIVNRYLVNRYSEPMKPNPTVAWLILLGAFTLAPAQFLPSPQFCNRSEVTGSAAGHVDKHGRFELTIEVSCQPDTKDGAFPRGDVSLFIELNDPRFRGTLTATVIEGARTIGHVAPMVFVSGQCDLPNVNGCRFWLFLADNDHLDGDTPDIVGFLVLDSDGSEIAYASGPAERSTLSITAER